MAVQTLCWLGGARSHVRGEWEVMRVGWVMSALVCDASGSRQHPLAPCSLHIDARVHFALYKHVQEWHIKRQRGHICECMTQSAS